MADPPLSAEMLLVAYASGIFPMADGRGARGVHWVDPKHRGVLPLSGFHISRSLRRAILRGNYEVRADSDFAGVVAACADRKETWISRQIYDAYLEVFAAGFAHSLEIWDGTRLLGGVYGVALGAAFFGESMFSRRTDASKIALAFLVDRLLQGGFRLFDTQFLTPHLATLGVIEISRAEYRRQLAAALPRAADFGQTGPPPQPSELLQRISQTS